jgi:phosphatidate cytidylyltransferase
MRRLLTAFVLIPIILYAVLWAPGWIFLAVVSAVCLLCFHEYRGLVAGHGIEPPGPSAYAAGLIVLLFDRQELLVLTLLALVGLALALRVDPISKGLPYAAASLLGVVYIFGAMRCAVALRTTGPLLLFFALVINWVGDTAAFYFGKAAGRHKMAPRLSPAKSWEGAAASVVASVACGAVFFHFVREAPMFHGLLLAAAGNVAGQIGDLAESALKRGAGVKDSGNLLPGHGGWLDRVDSTLFSVPVVWAYFALVK